MGPVERTLYRIAWIMATGLTLYTLTLAFTANKAKSESPAPYLQTDMVMLWRSTENEHEHTGVAICILPNRVTPKGCDIYDETALPFHFTSLSWAELVAQEVDHDVNEIRIKGSIRGANGVAVSFEASFE